MNKEEKTAIVENLLEEIQSSQAIFALDYRGISVSQIATLRSNLREADSTFRVVKNSLTERAADKAGVEDLKASLEGPTALTFVKGDIAAAAKALSDFASEFELLAFKGGLMDGNIVDADQFTTISRLPNREILVGRLAGMVASPLNGLARSLNGLIAGLAVQLSQIHEQGLLPKNES